MRKLMARIFIAIRFNDEFKAKLISIQDILKERGVLGNYCSYSNLHMTLAFIGEITHESNVESSSCEQCLTRSNPAKGKHFDLTAIRKAVSEVEFEPFEMSLGHLGTFPTKAGVIWCGVKDGDNVTALASRLRERLTANGVSFSRVAFVPHISLVQHPSTIITDIAVPEASIRVEKINVMKSERIEGQLVYSEI